VDWYLAVIYRSAVNQMKLSLARTMMRFVILIQPLVFATLSYFMLRRSGMVGYGEYVVTGSGLITLWMSTLWSSATDIDRERWMGTLEVLLVAPIPFPAIVLGKILGNLVLGYVAFALTYIYSLVVLRVPMPMAHPWRVVIGLAALTVALVGFSLFLGLLFTLSRRANVVANGLSFPMYLVSGLYFPLAFLPVWARGLGLAMPLAWAKEALRWAVVGEAAAGQMVTPSFWAAVSGLTLLGLGYTAGALLLYRYVIHYKIRRQGQLGLA